MYRTMRSSVDGQKVELGEEFEPRLALTVDEGVDDEALDSPHPTTSSTVDEIRRIRMIAVRRDFHPAEQVPLPLANCTTVVVAQPGSPTPRTKQAPPQRALVSTS